MTPKSLLLQAVCDKARLRRLSPRTLRAYVGWIRRFVRFHGRRHPRGLGEGEVAAFLNHLVLDRGVAPSTQTQALSALLFLYEHVLGRPLGRLEELRWAKARPRVPVVLTRAEVERVLAELRGTPRLVAMLLYGSGLRLLECLQLRVKDVDLGRREIRVRDTKGGRPRVTVLPEVVRGPLARHLSAVRRLHREDLVRGAGYVALPGALARKYPNAAREWVWQWVFPATRRQVDRVTGERRRRHHLHASVVQRAVKAAVGRSGIG
ncbi:MAG: integron integrase, partial [Gemmatimonadales bacterium]